MADSVREESFGEPQSQSKPKSCAVPGCGMLGGRMFSIPKNAEMRETWKSCCKINRPLKKFMYVCSKHFQPSDFKMKGKYVVVLSRSKSLFVYFPGPVKFCVFSRHISATESWGNTVSESSTSRCP